MSQIKFYEQILIDKIFQIKLTSHQLTHISPDSVYLPSFSHDISQLESKAKMKYCF